MSETAGDSANRASVGVLYADNDSIDTLPHELGHAHGRPHAPCGGATDPDPKYPYPNAGIGAWGYSVVTRTLQPPTLHDQMSYCAPAWQSDYTYRALFDQDPRARDDADGRTDVCAHVPHAPRRERRHDDLGGEPFTTTSPLEGHPTTVSVVAAEGTVPKQVTGYAYGYDREGRRRDCADGDARRWRPSWHCAGIERADAPAGSPPGKIPGRASDDGPIGLVIAGPCPHCRKPHAPAIAPEIAICTPFIQAVMNQASARMGRGWIHDPGGSPSPREERLHRARVAATQRAASIDGKMARRHEPQRVVRLRLLRHGL
ncbi:MAG: M66 family metalloprotease [Polyangiaceae bacterium]